MARTENQYNCLDDAAVIIKGVVSLKCCRFNIAREAGGSLLSLPRAAAPLTNGTKT